jgi:uncharacterized protein YqjF (DUF2071 family)
MGLEPLAVDLGRTYFCHWPVAEREVAAVVPHWLTPDTADGAAWISALALRMDRFDAFGVPVRRNLAGVNLRTYVTTPDGQRAVYFLSLDITDRLAAETARRLFRLPYRFARVDYRTDDEGGRIESRPRDGSGATFRATFSGRVPDDGPDSNADAGARTARPDTLASFLVERTRYATTGPFGTRLVGGVGHDPWPLAPAEVSVADRSLLDAAGIETVEGAPLAHVSPGLRMHVGGLERIEDGRMGNGGRAGG